MFFYVSKLVWFVAAPVNAMVFALALAIVARWFGARRFGNGLATLATILLVLAGFSPVGSLLLRPLEDRFSPPVIDAPPTGIIVLGGSTDEILSDARHQVTISDAATRVTAAVELARRFPNARLVFSGGSGALLQHARTEADDTRTLWIALGVAPERITIEDRSRNTYENALFSQRLIAPKPDETWLLVTSAFHMPRSVGLFRAVNFPVVPYPVDYRTSDTWSDFLPPRNVVLNMSRVEVAAREWVGLAVYWATGRIATPFPGPSERRTKARLGRTRASDGRPDRGPRT